MQEAQAAASGPRSSRSGQPHERRAVHHADLGRWLQAELKHTGGRGQRDHHGGHRAHHAGVQRHARSVAHAIGDCSAVQRTGAGTPLVAESGYCSHANVLACARAQVVPLLALTRDVHREPLMERFATVECRSQDADAVTRWYPCWSPTRGGCCTPCTRNRRAREASLNGLVAIVRNIRRMLCCP